MFTLINILNMMSLTFGSYSINVFPEILDKEEEERLLNELAKGNKEARNTLIEHNLRLVAHIVKKFEKVEDNQDDLISIGTIGLIKGIDSFKLDKKNKLTTYVARCIENEILMYFRSNKKYINDVSLNDPIGIDKEGNEISLINIIKNNDEDMLTIVNNKENKELIYKLINKLNKREQEIIILRYGLNNQKELTQRDIASRLNISRSYVSRIEKRALTKLYKEIRKQKKT